jgi:hypothetical protein
VALLGPLVFGAIRYHASQGAIAQSMGGDVARLSMLGPVAYALYMHAQLALGGDGR